MDDPLRPDFMWLEHPSVIVVYGERGGGKSATAHYIIESRFSAKGIPCYMIAPGRLQKILRTDKVKVIGRRLPKESVVLIDDAQLFAHARQTWKNVDLDKLISMSRHKRTTIIFVTQFSRRLDVNVLTDADTNVFKQPPLMAAQLDRAQMRKMVKNIDEKFLDLSEEKPEEDMRAYSYVISNKPRYEGFVGPTPLCSYWSDELSRW